MDIIKLISKRKKYERKFKKNERYLNKITEPLSKTSDIILPHFELKYASPIILIFIGVLGFSITQYIFFVYCFDQDASNLFMMYISITFLLGMLTISIPILIHIFICRCLATDLLYALSLKNPRYSLDYSSAEIFDNPHLIRNSLSYFIYLRKIEKIDKKISKDTSVLELNLTFQLPSELLWESLRITQEYKECRFSFEVYKSLVAKIKVKNAVSKDVLDKLHKLSKIETKAYIEKEAVTYRQLMQLKEDMPLINLMLANIVNENYSEAENDTLVYVFVEDILNVLSVTQDDALLNIIRDSTDLKNKC